jgi:hypothetical protein
MRFSRIVHGSYADNQKIVPKEAKKQIVRADGILSPKPPGFRPPSPGGDPPQAERRNYGSGFSEKKVRGIIPKYRGMKPDFCSLVKL